MNVDKIENIPASLIAKWFSNGEIFGAKSFRPNRRNIMGGEKRKQLPKLAMPNSVFSHLWVVLVILLPTLCQGKNNILQTKVLFVFAKFDHCHSGHQIFISNSTSVMLTTTNSYLILSSKFIIPQQSKLFPSFLFVSVVETSSAYNKSWEKARYQSQFFVICCCAKGFDLLGRFLQTGPLMSQL